MEFGVLKMNTWMAFLCVVSYDTVFHQSHVVQVRHVKDYILVQYIRVAFYMDSIFSFSFALIKTK